MEDFRGTDLNPRCLPDLLWTLDRKASNSTFRFKKLLRKMKTFLFLLWIFVHTFRSFPQVFADLPGPLRHALRRHDLRAQRLQRGHAQLLRRRRRTQKSTPGRSDPLATGIQIHVALVAQILPDLPPTIRRHGKKKVMLVISHYFRCFLHNAKSMFRA